MLSDVHSPQTTLAVTDVQDYLSLEKVAEVIDGGEALSSTVPRVRRLAKVAARRNPNQGLTSEGETFIRPQRSSEHPG